MSQGREGSAQGRSLWLWGKLGVAAGLGALLLVATLALSRTKTPTPGDLNCDGLVNFADMEAFTLAGHDATAWCQQYGHDVNYLLQIADFNSDGKVDIDDIPGFAEVLAESLGLSQGGGAGRGGAMRDSVMLDSLSGDYVDLDIDSDNDNGLGLPDRSDAEDLMEDDPYLPGKEIQTGSGNAVKAVVQFDAGGASLMALDWRLTFPANVSVSLPPFAMHDIQPPPAPTPIASSAVQSGFPYPSWILGDMNCDGTVNGQDIDGFMLALFGTPPDYPEYYAEYPDCDVRYGDFNTDDLVNGQDTDGFVGALFGAKHPIPIRLLVTGETASDLQGETRIVAEAGTYENEEFEPIADPDAVRTTVWDGDVLPPTTAMGAARPWGAGLKVATYSTVNLRTGNLLTQIKIVGWPSFGPDMDFRLFHNSAAGNTTVPSGNGFALGPGWSLSYGGCLLFHYDDPENPSVVTRITVVEDDGRLNTFTLDANVWVPPTGVHDTLEAAPEGMLVPKKEGGDPTPPAPAWVLTRKNQWRRIYDEQGRLLYDADSNREQPYDEYYGQLAWAGHAIRVSRCPDDPEHWWYVNNPSYVPEFAGRVYCLRDMTVCRRLDFLYNPDEQDPNFGRLEYIREQDVLHRDWRFEYDEQTRWLSNVQLGTLDLLGVWHKTWQIDFTYTADGRVETLSDKEGKVYTYAYYDDGRLSQVTDPALETGDSAPTPSPQTLVYEYAADPAGLTTTYWDRRAKSWTWDFELWGGVARTADPLARERSFQYDEDYNRTQLTDERAHEWLATYDGRGNLLTLVDPLSHKWGWTYDEYNNVLTITPPAATANQLDTSKQVALIYDDEYYNHDQQQYLLADPTHLTLITEPDADAEYPPEPAETTLEYRHYVDGVGDAGPGELKRVTDQNGVQNTFEHRTHDGALADWYEGPWTSSLTQTYPVHTGVTTDAGGNLTNSTNWNSSGGGSFDSNNNPTGGTCSAREGNATLLGGPDPDPPDGYLPVQDCALYVPMPICYTCPTYEYDQMGHMHSATVTLSAPWKASDLSGPPYFGVAPEYSQRDLTLTYDPLYRLRTSTLATQEPSATEDNFAETDPELRPTVTRTFTFIPNENGSIWKMTDTEGVLTRYEYDDANWLTEVHVQQPGQSEVLMASYDYSAYATQGLIVATYANGTSTEWLLDDAGRIDRITHKLGETTLLDLDYTFTADNLVSSIAQTGSQGSYPTAFTYDKRGRLLTEARTGGNEQPPQCYSLAYTYDQVGNRLTKTDLLADPQVVTTYHYDTDVPHVYQTLNNRLMYYEVYEQTTPTPTLLETTWYAYNAGGHVKRIVTDLGAEASPRYRVQHFQYNGAQQMWLYRTFTCDGGCDPEVANDHVTGVSAWEFRYAADRQRYLVRERNAAIPDWTQQNHPPYLPPLENAPGRWHEYVGDQIYQDFALSAGEMTPEARYTHGAGGAAASAAPLADGALLAITDTNGDRFFHADMLGTTRLLTDASGDVSQAMAFTAFGELLGTPPTDAPRYGYAGVWGYQDDRLGTPTWTGPAALHVGARYYDGALGRFLARDPVGIAGSLSVYGYVHNRPTLVTDPWGLFVDFSYTGQSFKAAVEESLQHRDVGVVYEGRAFAVSTISAIAPNGYYALGMTTGELFLIEAETIISGTLSSTGGAVVFRVLQCTIPIIVY